MFLSIPYTLFLAFKSHLLITQQGLNFNIFGRSGSVNWEHLKRLERRETDRSYVCGIVLNSFAQLYRPLISFGATDETFISISHIVTVPTYGILWTREIDYDKFAQTDFGSDLLHYAPHLFEGKLSDKAKFYPES